MDPTVLFGTLYKSHYIISANFYLYLQYFQQKDFNFNKISESQTDTYVFEILNVNICLDTSHFDETKNLGFIWIQLKTEN